MITRRGLAPSPAVAGLGAAVSAANGEAKANPPATQASARSARLDGRRLRAGVSVILVLPAVLARAI